MALCKDIDCFQLLVLILYLYIQSSILFQFDKLEIVNFKNNELGFELGSSYLMSGT